MANTASAPTAYPGYFLVSGETVSIDLFLRCLAASVSMDLAVLLITNVTTKAGGCLYTEVSVGGIADLSKRVDRELGGLDTSTICLIA